MLDQANRLRLLMRAGAGSAAGVGRARPRFSVVAGAKGGVGTTTVAVNVAAALAKTGQRTALVDGDMGRADATALCGISEAYSIVDVLSGRRRVADVLQRGPLNVQVLPGAWATGHLTDCEPAAQERLIAQLAELSHIDQVVIDAGSGLNRVLERFWKSADQALLVTTPDNLSVMNGYAVLKTFWAGHREMRVRSVVNQAADRQAASEAHVRLAAACRRFLGLELKAGALLEASRKVAAATRRRAAFVVASPESSATKAIERLAKELTMNFDSAIQAVQV